jgi:hypothetical protein
MLHCNVQLFGTAAVRDALVALSPQVATAASTVWWCGAICNLTAANIQLFGTAQLRDALLALQTHATTVGACRWWCIAVATLVAPGANRMLFRVPAIRAAHATLRDLSAASAGASKWWHVVAALLR